ncbi:predicted protein [Naegleria gruberi]|uniref:Predicted protein n=1 Tax=Naegleria gruberi TaxID=5762 RepID=D2W4H3_NAEGR|nr:uncharacterized protein NAEGRDRAFT_76306 [Naegleria gruberi]EFC36029.1 predicted protein [Naegleria gruberi]|eukprot:XP_002668773.1 predicted protein [Naegleria gruberi strain NEG-M]
MSLFFDASFFDEPCKFGQLFHTIDSISYKEWKETVQSNWTNVNDFHKYRADTIQFLSDYCYQLGQLDPKSCTKYNLPLAKAMLQSPNYVQVAFAMYYILQVFKSM